MNRTSEIRSLTGLRGIAALYVVIFHALIIPASVNSPASTFLNHGYIAVDLFFILSGFVMALVHGQDFQNNFTLKAYKSFLFKRIARIYPLFFVVLTITLTLYYFNPERIPDKVDSLTVPHIMENYLLIQSWGFGKSYVQPSWSISTEFFAYLLFPVLSFLALYQSRKVAAVIAFTAFCMTLLLPVLFSGAKSNLNLDFWNGETLAPLLRCVAEFTLGILCYRVYSSGSSNLLSNKVWPTFVLAIAISSLLFINNTDFLIILLLPPFILSLTSENRLSRLMGGKPIHWLGLTSYSIYMVHGLVFYFREDGQAVLEHLHIPHAYSVSLAMSFPAIILAGALTYYFIEKPARGFIRKTRLRNRTIEVTV